MTEHPIQLDTIITYGKLKAKVIQPFTVRVRPTISGDDSIATSDCCLTYEFGQTPEEARQNFLEGLLDDLDWYKRNEEILPQDLIEDWNHLKEYVTLIEPEQEVQP